MVIEMATGKPPWSDYSPVAAMWHIASTGDMPTLPADGLLSPEVGGRERRERRPEIRSGMRGEGREGNRRGEG